MCLVITNFNCGSKGLSEEFWSEERRKKREGKDIHVIPFRFIVKLFDFFFNIYFLF